MFTEQNLATRDAAFDTWINQEGRLTPEDKAEA